MFQKIITIKKLVRFAGFFLFAGLVFASCKKSQNDWHPPVIKNFLTANAGADQIITLPSDSIVFNGSGSDSAGNIVNYNWRKITGPLSCLIVNPNSAVTAVKNLVSGVYEFELKVTDIVGLTAYDYLKITVKTSCEPENDFDIKFIDTYSFIKYYYTPLDSWEENTDPKVSYLTRIYGTGIFQPKDIFHIYVEQYADTAALSDIIYRNYIQINNSDGEIVVGNCSINFNKLIREGGGSFNGSFTITKGSATERCDANLFEGLPPLSVSGNVDVTTQIVTLKIKGKIFF